MSETEAPAAQSTSIHDNALVSYTVGCLDRRITLHTVFQDRDPAEHTDVVFSGVVGYHFVCDTLPSILFDVIPVSLQQLYSDYEDVFTRLRNHGWPPIRHSTEESLLDVLRARGIQGFQISSSYGLHGLVLAERMELLAVDS